MCKFFDDNRGMSLIELVVTMVILSILAGLILPSAKMTSTRTKELELRRSLREIRTALDEYKKHYDKAVEEGKLPKVENLSGYPETLQVLVDGYDFGGLVKTQKKFLRRIPKDPFDPDPTDDELWNMRSYADDKDSTSWGGQDVFDVYSWSEATAIDGTKYKDW
jgi:general secretion pathway protein G